MKRVLAEQIAEKERQKKEEEERRWADEHFGRMLLGYHQWFLTMHNAGTNYIYFYTNYHTVNLRFLGSPLQDLGVKPSDLES